MQSKNNSINLTKISNHVPVGVSHVRGSADNSQTRGTVRFYQTTKGVVVVAEIHGLPIPTERCENNIFAFHIHGGSSCTGNAEDPFANAGTHYNPTNCPHPYHAGDMPPLFASNGTAFMAFLTNRFTAKEVIGKTVIIHDSPDNFTTHPSGNAGKKIACGEIVAVRRS